VRGVSATALEDAARCPFRFFLRTGLGIEAIADDDRDADVWLDPLTRGSHLHDLYAALTRRARDARRPVSREADLEWFLALGRARLDELEVSIPPPSAEVYATESAEWLADLELFVDLLARDRGVEPIGIEVGFGRACDDETEPLARREPVAVPLGGSRRLWLTGRIDRVDRIGPHRYQVVDYKTGRFWREGWRGVFAGASRLQHALYAVAADALLQRIDPAGRVVRGVYTFPTGRGWGRQVVIERPDDRTLRGVLSDLAEVIASGTFVQTSEERECAWCDFGAACGREPWRRASRKRDANAGGRLDAWIRLQEHE
jgi:ATP-dependent helicase/nuclease subunit B